jgi:Mn2+/Fe2+ NRAMP family transporter
MGTLVNRSATTVAVSIVASLIVALNGFLLYQTLFG